MGFLASESLHLRKVKGPQRSGKGRCALNAFPMGPNALPLMFASIGIDRKPLNRPWQLRQVSYYVVTRHNTPLHKRRSAPFASLNLPLGLRPLGSPSKGFQPLHPEPSPFGPSLERSTGPSSHQTVPVPRAFRPAPRSDTHCVGF